MSAHDCRCFCVSSYRKGRPQKNITCPFCGSVLPSTLSVIIPIKELLFHTRHFQLKSKKLANTVFCMNFNVFHLSCLE